MRDNIIIGALVILSLGIGYEQGAKHSTEAFTYATRSQEITERERERERIRLMAQFQPCTTDTDCQEKFPELVEPDTAPAN